MLYRLCAICGRKMADCFDCFKCNDCGYAVCDRCINYDEKEDLYTCKHCTDDE